MFEGWWLPRGMMTNIQAQLARASVRLRLLYSTWKGNRTREVERHGVPQTRLQYQTLFDNQDSESDWFYSHVQVS
jgi:hypothetical protein